MIFYAITIALVLLAYFALWADTRRRIAEAKLRDVDAHSRIVDDFAPIERNLALRKQARDAGFVLHRKPR